MNRKKGYNSKTRLLISVLVILSVAVTAYWVGRRSRAHVSVDASIEEKNAAQLQSQVIQGRQALSAIDLAKAKGVPDSLEDPGGDYQLIAVIEGDESNRKLTSSLQVVGVQRQRLLSLSRQYDGLPADSLQQRELIAGEILKARKTLATNLDYMAQNYGYSLKNNYRLIPHSASLFLITRGEEDKLTSTLVHEFEDAESYRRFQQLRDDYLLLSNKEGKSASSVGINEGGLGNKSLEDEGPELATEGLESPVSEIVSEPSISPELKAKQDELIKLFQYDPIKSHQVGLNKTAFYGRSGAPK
tara:strand:+ start:761 stop:1663 length:903 start_codon:yes stop_codon:yes gene_type:complete